MISGRDTVWKALAFDITHLTILPFQPVPVMPTDAATEGLPRCEYKCKSA